MGGSLRLDPLGPDDWEQLREVRLRALADAPEAFLSDYAEVRRWREDEWRRTLADSLWVVAHRSGRTIGVARSVRDQDGAPGRRYIEAVWVDPRCRLQGVGRRLILWLVEQQLRVGIRDILIWVIDSNEPARALYEGLGFKPTGERQPVAGHGTRFEERLRLPINETGPRL